MLKEWRNVKLLIDRLRSVYLIDTIVLVVLREKVHLMFCFWEEQCSDVSLFI